MKRYAALAIKLLVGATAIGSVACAGASANVPANTSKSSAGSSRAPSVPASNASGGVEIIAGAPTLKVAGPPVEGGLLGGAEVQLLGQVGRRAGDERKVMEPEVFRVGDLPLVEFPEPLNASAAPGAPPVIGEDASELFVDWQSALRGNSILGRPETYTSVRVSLAGQRLARIRIGGSEGTVIGGSGGGVYVVCRVPEDAPKRFVSARWEVLSSAPPGASSAGAQASPTNAKGLANAQAPASPKVAADAPATLTVTDAWFDMHECKATIVRRTSVQARALAGGMLFAYRERCAKCAPGAQTELVTLLGPMPALASASGIGADATTTLGAVSRVTLPIRRGGGGSLVARYTAGITRDWLGALSRDGAPSSDVVVGVDVTQGVGDPEPLAIAYSSGVADRMADPALPNPQPSGDLFGSIGAPQRVAPKKPNEGSGLVDPFQRRSKLGF